MMWIICGGFYSHKNSTQMNTWGRIWTDMSDSSLPSSKHQMGEHLWTECPPPPPALQWSPAWQGSVWWPYNRGSLCWFFSFISHPFIDIGTGRCINHLNQQTSAFNSPMANLLAKKNNGALIEGKELYWKYMNHSEYYGERGRERMDWERQRKAVFM